MTQDTKELVNGFPTNRRTQSKGIFGNLYFLSSNGDLPEWGQAINGGFLEYHFQQFSELPKPEEMEGFLREIKEYKDNGLDVIMHTPFMKGKHQEPDKNGFLEFDFNWLVQPKRYKDSSVKTLQLGEKSVAWNCHEASLEDILRTVDVAAEAGIKYLTMHVTMPGVFLEGNDWERYKERMAEIAEYIVKNKKDVTFTIETGGVTPEQLIELYHHVHTKTGYKLGFNLDTAHLLLDFMEIEKNRLMKQGTPEDKAKSEAARQDNLDKFNRKIMQFYDEHKDKIHVIHLSQTNPWQDLHKGIEDDTKIVACNEALIRMANEDFAERGKKRYVMIESWPTLDGIRYFVQAKKGLVHQRAEQGNNYSAYMFMGKVATGKTIAREILAAAGIFGTKPAIIRSDKIKEEYQDVAAAMVAGDRWVSRQERQLVYDEVGRLTTHAMGYHQGPVLDATFAGRDNRDDIYELARMQGVKDLYLFSFNCLEDEARYRIRDRKKRLDDALGRGEKPTERMTMAHTRFLRRSNSEFDELLLDEEFKSTDGLNVHVIEIDTTTGINKITLYNPDQQARVIAEELKKAYKDRFNFDYQIETKTRDQHGRSN
ncbi:TPA: TIM barrel protein [Candidatus Woesearchaeota archaeon]|nr:TIM barrel protein [Candidatus Woesearchaeota archaeon]